MHRQPNLLHKRACLIFHRGLQTKKPQQTELVDKDFECSLFSPQSQELSTRKGFATASRAQRNANLHERPLLSTVPSFSLSCCLQCSRATQLLMPRRGGCLI